MSYNGRQVYNRQEISNMLGRHLAAFSSVGNLDAHFQIQIDNIESVPLNFQTVENFNYSKLCTMEEIENALSSCKSSAFGRYISFEIIKQLSPLAKSYTI